MSDAGVIIRGDLEQDLRALLGRMDNVVVRELLKAAEDVEATAAARAPVKTGAFKRGYGTYVQLRGGRLMAGVRNLAPHARFVKPARAAARRSGPVLPGQADAGTIPGSVWTIDVSGPMKLQALRLGRELGPLLVKAVR